MKDYATIAERIYRLTKENAELSLAVEGRFTNLRIWVSDNDDKTAKMVYMRLDKFEAYSAPFKPESASYLRKPNPVIDQLLQYGFVSPITCLNDILEITKELKYRQCKEW